MAAGPVTVPTGLARQAALGPDWARWLDRLPRLAGDLLDEWQLRPDGAAGHGYCSLVLPVRDGDGAPAALKLTFDGDEESAHEALVLQHWHGAGAVRLLRADPRCRALLLERAGPGDLTAVGARTAAEVVAALYPRLHRPALPQLPRLATCVDRWLGTLARVGRHGPVPRRLVEQALSLGADLVADRGPGDRVVHGDLHDGNVLSGRREPWLVIDPKPMAGDPHYEPAPLLWNRWDDLVATGDVRSGLRRLLDAVVTGAGLDEDRARDWVVVRSLVNAGWAVADATGQGRGLTAGERRWITVCVTTAKAVQP